MAYKLLWVQLLVLQIYANIGSFGPTTCEEIQRIFYPLTRMQATEEAEATVELTSHDELTTVEVTTRPPKCNDWSSMCYYDSTSINLPEPMRFEPSFLPTGLCTFVVFCCATIEKNMLIPRLQNDIGLYNNFRDRKLTEPDLKILLSIGGKNTPEQEKTNMLATPDSRKTFIESAIVLLRKHEMDGLDIDCNLIADTEKEKFNLLIQEIRRAFEVEVSLNTTHNVLLLLVSVGGLVDKLTCDVKTINKNVDYMHLKAYDFHETEENVTTLSAPLFKRSSDEEPKTKLNVEYAARYLNSSGIPAFKLIIGMPLHGIGFTLSNPKQHNLSAPVVGPALPGMFSHTPGVLSLYEVCYYRSNNKTGIVWDEEQKSNYLYLGNQWITYESLRSITAKINWIKVNGYVGWSVSNLAFEDKDNVCGQGSFPILNILRKLCRHTPLATQVQLRTTSKGVEWTTTQTTKKATSAASIKKMQLISVFLSSLYILGEYLTKFYGYFDG